VPRAKKAKAPDSLYDVHPGVAMVQRWVAELKDKTGKTLEEWQEYIVAHGPKERKQRVLWLKEKSKLGTNYASWLAERADGQPTWDESPESYLSFAPKYVDEMFAGPKAALLPAYYKLLELGRSVGDDVKFCPCRTIVPFYRNHVFAQAKPATRTRIDFGFALGDTKATGKLIDTGGFKKKDRITHCIPITGVDDIDVEVRRWLKMAYDRDA
jgi:hypothetical protein